MSDPTPSGMPAAPQGNLQNPVPLLPVPRVQVPPSPVPQALPASSPANLNPIDLTHVNYGPLTAPISSAQVRAFRAQIRSEQRANPGISTALTTATSVIIVVFWLVFIGIFVAIFGGFLVELASQSSNSAGAIIPLACVFGFIALTGVIIARHFGSGGPWGKWMRLTQFAAANGLEFSTRSNQPHYSGMIFNIGDDRFAYDHLTSTKGRFFDLGSYEYSTGSGKNRSTSHWGFLALRLDRKLPNMVLDSKENNTLFGSDLPTHFSRDQILSLEGDFDKHFTLYCPKEYETDALYVFTPDLMALLIDDAGSFDVEIVDDWMFIYTPHALPPLSPAVYQRLFTIVQTVGNKTITQTANYHDYRVGSSSANIVAPAGQRLRHGTSIGTVIVFALFAGFWLWSMFHGS